MNIVTFYDKVCLRVIIHAAFMSLHVYDIWQNVIHWILSLVLIISIILF